MLENFAEKYNAFLARRSVRRALFWLILAMGVFAGLDIWGRATIKTDAGEQEFPPEAVRIRGL